MTAELVESWHFDGHAYTRLDFEEGLRFFDNALGVSRQDN